MKICDFSDTHKQKTISKMRNKEANCFGKILDAEKLKKQESV